MFADNLNTLKVVLQKLLKNNELSVVELCNNNNISDKRIVKFLTKTQRELKKYYYPKNTVERNIKKASDILIEYAKNNYAKEMEFVDDDNFDCLTVGINFLGQELNYSTVTIDYTQDIFNSLGDLLLVVDKKGYLLYVSRPTLSILGYKEEDIKGQNIKMLLEKDIDVINLTKENIQFKQINFITSKGQKIPVSLKISNFSRKDNPLMGYVIVARDLSHFLKHQQEIEEINKKLLKANKQLSTALKKAQQAHAVKSIFLANISHEIRTPLNGIMGFGQLLKEENKSIDELQQYGGLIYKAGTQLLNVVNAVLEFSKIESGTLKLSNKVFSLNILLKELESIYKQKICSENKKINFKVKFDLEDNKSYIKSDDTRLNQILYNLLDNAFKFTKEGSIELAYTCAKNKLIFYVKDTGIGIPKDKMDIIFQPFMQTDNTLTKAYGGTGLGLPIASGIVKLFNGKIWVESKLNAGSCFYFEIPYIKAAASKPAINNINNYDNYIWKNKNIVVVEDNEITILFYKHFLSKTQANIFYFEKATEAIKHIKKLGNKVDLIFMDLRLPDLDGISATKIIRTFNKEVKIIAQSAHVYPEDKLKCLNAGCDDFLPKPVESHTLMKLTDKLLKEKENLYPHK